MKIKKILNVVLFSMILILLSSYRVYAAEVYINNHEKDIYETGGEGSATFDKTSNTLTLNGYVGDFIEFADFSDGDVINIIVKGINTIDGGDGNTSNDGILLDNDATLNITGTDGAKLIINNYYDAIYLYDGELNVKNLNLTMKNHVYCGVYNHYGVVNITDVKIDSDNIGYPIASDGNDINVKNLTLNVKTTTGYTFYSEGITTIEDSNIEGINDYGGFMYSDVGILIKNSVINVEKINDGIYSDGDITIEDTDYTVSDGYSGVYGIGNVTIKNSNIDFSNVYEGVYSASDVSILGGTFKDVNDITEDVQGASVYADGNLIINSDVTVDYQNPFFAPVCSFGKMTINGGNINVTNASTFGIMAGELEVNDGIINVNAHDMGIYTVTSNGKLIFNNGIIHVKTNSGAALVAYGDDMAPGEMIVLNNMMIEEDGLELVKTLFEGDYIYSVSGEEVLSEYDDYEALVAVGAPEVTIISTKRIDFNANGGSGEMDSIFKSGTVTLPDNEFVAPDGKKFKGWSLSTNGEIITSINVDGIKTVYAIWEDINPENPATADKIILYVIINIGAILGILFAKLKLTKKKAN